MRKALGKGIDALISRVQENDIGGQNVKKIPLENIIPNRLQPRQDFDEEAIKELAASIKKHGLAQPIIVQETGEGKYEIIAGERRFRAFKYLGLPHIEAIVRKNMEDEKKLALALIENLQRENLNPVERALAYKKLMSDYGMNQTEAAEFCGKSKYVVSNAIRLLELDEEMINSLRGGGMDEGHARALLGVPDKAERKRIFERIISEKLSVRDVEAMAKTFHKPSNRKKRSDSQKAPEVSQAEAELERALGAKVEIIPGPDSRVGKIILHYYSLEDFDRIVFKLKN
ncbi:MAG: ParB/RepB/Spo0J family partition protein [Elusimicrobiota bacterium]